MTVETMIERVDLKTARGFPKWLGAWAKTERDGWDTTVLVDGTEGHAVALACRPCPTVDQQLSLLADGDAA